MIFSKRSFLAFVFFASSISLFSQDLIYDIKGEYESSSIALDSILVENLSNGTRLHFGLLPIQTEYRINLSTGEQLVPTGIDNYFIENHIRLVSNQPGNLRLAILSNRLRNMRVTVYNIQGQAIETTQNLYVRSGNQLNISLPVEGVFIVKVATEFGNKAYKTTGSINGRGTIQISIDGESVKESGTFKSAKESNLSDFSFQPGDSLRVYAFREGFYSRPVILEITESESILFPFSISSVETNGISDVYTKIDESSYSSIEYSTSSGEVQIIPKEGNGGIGVGDIITVELDTAGYLRKVISISEEDGAVILETEQASLNELFVDKAFSLSTSMIEPSASFKGTGTMMEISEALTDDLGYIHPLKVILFDSAGQVLKKDAYQLKSTTDDIQLPIIHEYLDFSLTDLYGEEGDNIHFFISEGEITFETDAVFEFDFTYDGEFSEDTKVKKGDLNIFEFYLEATAGVHTKVELDMSKSWDKTDGPKKLFKIAKARAQFVVPPGVPVWIDFDVNMYRAIILHADASLHADWGFEVKDTLRVGGRYTRETKELTPISEFKHHHDIFPLNIIGEINASARLEIFPRVDIKFYSIFGPYAEVVPYVKANYNAAAQVQITPSGSEAFVAYNSGLDLGLDLRVGTELKILGLEKEYGPKIIPFSEDPLPLWRSPFKIELLTVIPEEVATGGTISLSFKVTDMLGLPAIAPVYIDGDGTFNKHIFFSDLSGELIVEWTIGEAEGTYDINATIFNADKVIIDIESESMVAIEKMPIAAFTASKTAVFEGEDIAFTDQSTNNPTDWYWNFGDGSTSSLQNPTHSFSSAGSYTVNLTATNSYGSGIETKTDYITVSSLVIAPVAAFTASSVEITAGETINFTDQSTNEPTEWLWNFGDGGTSHEQNPSYTYNTAGSYHITLTVNNETGSDTEIKSNYITVISYSSGNETGSLHDSRDGQDYITVKIGDQWWMAENLAYLPTVSPSSAESYTSPNYYVYGYEGDNVIEAKATENFSTYGVLYNFPAARTDVCPDAWHLPHDAAWTTLTNYLGGSSVAGGKMKETGTQYWNSPNTGATNESDFSALPCGQRGTYGGFKYLGRFGYWWSSSQGPNTGVAWVHYLENNYNGIHRSYLNKDVGFSIRCVKD